MTQWKIILATLLGLGATAAIAEVQDTDGDGVYSMEEVKATYPDLTEDVFAQLDANGDGALDVEELAVAQSAGILKAG
ncbi:hypothetical protein N9L47_03110 [Rhodobacteraceae bacterium]|nr:hypothetical protein [Paracoccaceae bacterium]